MSSTPALTKSPLRAWMAAQAPLAGETVALIVAHPDDDVVGAGGNLQSLGDIAVVHVTDGAPRNLADAQALGLHTREEYATVRTWERAQALELAGIPCERARCLGIVDQEASLQLAPLAQTLLEYLLDSRPGAILTHPYEGGHPDHDATAFAVHAACGMMRRRGGSAPPIFEMAFYHGALGAFRPAEFLPHSLGPELVVTLDDESAASKRRLFECHKSQRRALQHFPMNVERFRLAPHYAFEEPPHAGRLYYEHFDWGMDGARWRSLAQAAQRELDAKAS